MPSPDGLILRPEVQRAWWKEATIYQIYPSSFCDSNGDGIGDLVGIHSKLDYLKALGVDVVWLSPIYKSPQADMGYDISDYRDIDPRYGTLEDWDKLVQGLHDRGMKMMMDLVVNHTSDEHEWFKESRSSKASPKRDWYIWRPAKYDAQGHRHPPNNWKSVFQGSAWTWDETSQEYYLHLYLVGQPDLNWENGDVREAVWDVMRFWLNRGTDGFRMDVINLISKAPDLPDAPVSNPREEYQPAPMYFANGPRVHEFIQEMNTHVLSSGVIHLPSRSLHQLTDLSVPFAEYQPITVGEAPFTHDMHALARYVLPANKELNMVFHFELMDIDGAGENREFPLIPREWKLAEFKDIITRWQVFLREEGFWNTVFIENHDHARSISRFTSDEPQWRAISAKMLALLQIAQTGTLFVYQGEEIAMANVPRSWGIEEYKDIASQNFYNRILQERIEDGKGDDMSDILDGFQKKARDNGRTPVQWDATHEAGFTTGTPWMRVNDDYNEWNVASQRDDPLSVWNFWKEALRVRKDNEILIYGDFKIVDEPNDEVFAFTRSFEQTTVLVVLNFTKKEVEFTVGDLPMLRGARLLLSNYAVEDAVIPAVLMRLRGFEGRIYMVKQENRN